jgi:hypothetical protein
MAEAERDTSFQYGVKKFVGSCPATLDLESLICSIELAQNRMELVLQGGEILSNYLKVGVTLDKLKEANGKLGQVVEVLNGLKEFGKDLEAMKNIHAAMAGISPDDFRNDPDKAAKAFDKFFVGLARVCRFTQALKPYQQFFESFGTFFQAFANLRKRKEAEVYPEKKGGSNFAGY